ncbi:hypothetical protein [Phenylobacterium sp.]|uniref:hypothetical protein n=1 Tax=Phenylobacterium sp. TaxID=1871053 RepID=UPI002DF36B72|nr:hypothetical protein [Phenylobacterium sp.]
MTAIRPQAFPPLQGPTSAPRADQAKLAAQKAFFDAALGKTAAAAPAAAMAKPAPVAAPLQRIPDAAAEKPEKILRPGSLLDIRV